MAQRGAAGTAANDTTAIRSGSDTELNAPLPVRPLTHQDSLNIAEAFRDQLAQIDPRYRKQPVASKAVDTVPLDVELHLTDSLIRERLRELYPSPGRGGEEPARPPGVGVTAAPTVPVVPTPPEGAAGTGTPHRLAIVLSPERRGDTTLLSLQHAVAAELSRRLTRPGEWEQVTIDSEMQGSRFRPDSGNNADVVVYMTLRRDQSDSVRMVITVRNSAPGTNYGFRVIASDPVYKPTDTRPFMQAIFAADRLLRDVHRIPAGEPWPQDLGQGQVGRPGYPNPSMVRIYTPQQVDSLRHRADSLRGGRSGRAGPRPDILP